MKIDRSILQANDQEIGDFGDPDKIESSINHLANVIDENDNGFSSHKTALELDHPDKSVTEKKLADSSVSSRTVKPGAIGTRELDPSLFSQPTTTQGVQAKFQSIDEQLADIRTDVKNKGADSAGTIDCSTLIQSLIDSGSKHLHFPDGLYTLANVTLADNVKITQNKNAILQLPVGSNGFIFKIIGKQNVSLEGLHLKGDLSTFNGGVLINYADTDYSKDITIKDCLLENFGQYGVEVIGTIENLNVKNNKVLNFGSSVSSFPKTGIIVFPKKDTSKNIFVKNNIVEMSPTVAGASASLKVQTAQNCIVTGNILNGGAEEVVSLAGAGNLVFSDNEIIGNGSLGLNIQTDSIYDGVTANRRWIISNNTLAGTFSNALTLGQTGTTQLVTIKGNRIAGIITMSQNAIADKLVIEDNYCEQVDLMKYSGTSITNSTIKGNTCGRIRVRGNYNRVKANIVRQADFTGVTGNGIEINNGNDNFVSGNDVTNTSSNGIAVDTGNNNIISNNNVKAATANGIRVDVADATIITFNTVKGGVNRIFVAGTSTNTINLNNAEVA